MNQVAIFASKHKQNHLPLKYMRRSVTSMFQKENNSKFNVELKDIDWQFRNFIETPIHKG